MILACATRNVKSVSETEWRGDGSGPLAPPRSSPGCGTSPPRSRPPRLRPPWHAHADDDVSESSHLMPRERIIPSSEVIRGIFAGDSPCCGGGPATRVVCVVHLLDATLTPHAGDGGRWRACVCVCVRACALGRGVCMCARVCVCVRVGGWVLCGRLGLRHSRDLRVDVAELKLTLADPHFGHLRSPRN